MFNDKGKTFFNIGMAIVSILVLIVFFTAIYESLSGKKIGENNILGDPEIIAVVIGLIISLLFVERLRSLESRVQKLSESPVDAINKIEEYAQKAIDLKFKDVENKAQTLSANVSSLVEKHPWLEVITEREMIIDTDSCRGILRTCYSLLKEKKFLHLFEYLEHCSRKGTSKSKEKDSNSLYGTADDFYELSLFCEIWLGDYFLSSQFLKRYIEQYPESSYILMPEYIRKLIRIGDLGKAKELSNSLRKKIYGNTIYDRLMIRFKIYPSVSEKYKWQVSNILALNDATLADNKRIEKYKKESKDNKFAERFREKQLFYDIELQIQLGEFSDAESNLIELEKNKLKALDLNELSFLYSKLGDYDKASDIKERIAILHADTFGDDFRENTKIQIELNKNNKKARKESKPKNEKEKNSIEEVKKEQEVKVETPDIDLGRS